MFSVWFVGMCFFGLTHAAEYQKASDTLFSLIAGSCITSASNEAHFHELSHFVQKNKSTVLNLNSSYYVKYLFKDSQEPFTPLTYACYSPTCDYRVVNELCAVGADPNRKYTYGFYPATYIFKSLIRLYPKRDEHAEYIKNQVQKLSILNDTVQLYPFVTIDTPHDDGDDVYLAVDRCVNKLITPEIKVWLQQLLEQPIASLNFESQDWVYKLQ